MPSSSESGSSCIHLEDTKLNVDKNALFAVANLACFSQLRASNDCKWLFTFLQFVLLRNACQQNSCKQCKQNQPHVLRPVLQATGGSMAPL